MAARCHNRATPEYKALLQEFKTNIATDNVITSWQDLNNTNEFPTVSQAQEFLKQYKTSESLRKREFAEALLSNLSRLGYAKAGKNGYYVTNSNQPGGIFDENVLNSNRNKIINYLMMNNIPVDSVSFSDTTKGETYFISIDDASLSQRDILPKRRGFDEPKTVKILNHLNNLFPELNIQIATIQEARNYYDSLDPAMKANVKFEDVKSFYVRGKVYLVRGRVTDDTAIEEVLHPFVDALFIQNRALFDNLLKEARTNFPELNKEINRVYSEMNGFTQEERDLELVTQSLTRHFANEYEKAPTKTFMDRIREFLQWFSSIINDFHKYLTGISIRRADQITSASSLINFKFKATEKVLDNLTKIKQWESNKSIDQNTLWKKIGELGIPKQELDLLKESEGNTIEEKLVSFVTNYSYTVEINTAIQQITKSKKIDIGEEQVKEFYYNNARYSYFKEGYFEAYYIDDNGEQKKISKETFEDAFNKANIQGDTIPTQYYSNLTVPGGTNYTENELATPAITPSIKGHAQFATDNGIGWFRSDDRQLNLGGAELSEEYKPDIEQLPNGKWEVSYLPITGGRKLEFFKTEQEAKDFVKSITKTSDEKTRRILEVQSDLFQKGRDLELLVESKTQNRSGIGSIPYTTTGMYAGLLDKIRAKANEVLGESRGERPDGQTINLDGNTYYTMNGMWYLKEKEFNNENQFLQLLNKDNNWVTFFVKSIIQDSAKKGYEKVLFPSGNTASIVEGHTTLEEFKKQKEDRIKELEKPIEFEVRREIGTSQYRVYKKLTNTSQSEGLTEEAANKRLLSLQEESKTWNIKEITQLKRELERIETEGFGALKPIYNFYENTVTNILKKQYGKENVKQVTDEYGNTWNELSINQARDLPKTALIKQSGPVLSIDDVKPTAKLSDIAKLLNTSMFTFNLQTEDSSRVRYALSDRKQKLVDKALDSSNDVQKNVINRLFGIARTRDESIDSLSANIYSPYEDSSIVVLNKADHTYIDIITGDIYTSVTTAIKGKLKNEEDVQLNITLGNDFDFIMDGIVSNMTLKDILESGEIKILNQEQVERAFNDLQEKIQDLRADGSVAISQVVLFDEATKIAGTADLVLITPDGKLKILDLKTSKSWYATMREEYDKEWNLEDDSVLKSRGIADKLSTRQQHNLQVNLYRRMAENMGYDVATDEYATSTYHIHVDITGKGKEQKFEGTFEVDGWVAHPPSQNSVYVDKLVPVDYMNRDPEITAARLGLDSPEDFDPDNFLDPEEQLPEDFTDENDYTEFNTIFNALNQYKTGLLNRRQAIERIKSGIFMDRRTEQIIENIDNTVGAIMVAMSEGGALVSSTYTDLLRDAIKEVDQFTEYMLDPSNFDKNEYINYALNFDRFLVTFNGLTEIQKSDAVNATQAKLLLNLETKLRALGGTKTKTGIIDAAIMNYVKETVRNTSSRNFTEAELDELMRTAKDIGILDLGTRDLATSTDTLLAIMDKIYKAKKQELYDKIDARNEEIINAANKLLKLSPTSNRNEIYDFMLEFDDQGGFTGRYVKALGKQYYQKIDKLRAELFDEEGNWKEYREIDDLRTAKQEDIDYNKALYKAKQAYADFWRAETIGVNDTPIDGEYHGYTAEFKEARAKHEVFVAEGKHGYWVRKKGISDKAYLNYKLKYFDAIETKFAVKKNGVFTGKVTDGTIQVPKVKYRFAREISSKGEDMRNAKYTAIMNPTDALGEARKEFYEVYVKNFENDLLNKLPTGVRDQMLGKVPLVQSNLVNSLKDRGNLFTKLWSKTTRSVKNLTTETSHMRRVVVDETGQFVDTLPIFYVGNTRDDQALTVLEAKLDQLNKERKMGAINAIEYKKQSMELNGKIADIKNKPATNEISKDMGDSLLKFSAMAEHYETMGAIEDTMNAFLYVIENRQYESADDNVTRVARYGKENIKVFQKKGSTEANVITRAKKFMSMVYYDSEEITKGKWDKISDFIINTSSMTYVAFNPFGNLNNYVMGKLNNNIELLGQRFFSAKAGLRAKQEFAKRAVPDVVKRFGMHGYKLGMGGQYDPTKPMSKYEGFVDFLRMMDKKSDIRETRESTAQKSWFQNFFIEKVGYGLQDAAEYAVQTEVGMAMVIDTILKNKTTGETLSLYDAAEFDSVTHKLKFKDGFDTVVKKNGVEVAFDDKFRYDLRNRIREVNKQIHGNYAREDRMVIQANALGKLAAQFHKWVAPAIRARFGKEYFDENLGWMEGRYKSFWQFMGYFFRNLDKIEMTGKIIGPKMKEGFLKDYGYKGDGSQDDAKAENKLYNTYRTLGELAIIISIMVVREILGGMLSGDDDDSETIKRLENAILFQADRSVKEMKTFIPVFGFTDMYQMAKSPVASTRTLAEWGQALGSTMLTGYNGVKYMATDNPEYWEGNKDIVYQRRPDKGNLKMAKEWKDAIPILYTFQRWASYDTVSDFYIK